MNLQEAYLAHFAACTYDWSAQPTSVLNGRTVRSHPFTADVEEQGHSFPAADLNHVQVLSSGEWKDVPVRQEGPRLVIDWP